jgi:hypothetical protein
MPMQGGVQASSRQRTTFGMCERVFGPAWVRWTIRARIGLLALAARVSARNGRQHRLRLARRGRAYPGGTGVTCSRCVPTGLAQDAKAEVRAFSWRVCKAVG